MSASMTPRSGVRIVGTITVAALLTGVAGAFPASADDGVPPPEGEWTTLAEMGFDEPNTSQRQDSIIKYELNTPIRYSTEDSVEPLEETTQEGDETVINLSTDILFSPDSWDLPDAADVRIEELVEDVPRDAELAVHGHTDSVVGEVDNDDLSQQRAEAVAEVLSTSRSDLTLEVEGFGDAKPAEEETGDDIEEARQANRRVELRYDS